MFSLPVIAAGCPRWQYIAARTQIDANANGSCQPFFLLLPDSSDRIRATGYTASTSGAWSRDRRMERERGLISYLFKLTIRRGRIRAYTQRRARTAQNKWTPHVNRIFLFRTYQYLRRPNGIGVVCIDIYTNLWCARDIRSRTSTYPRVKPKTTFWLKSSRTLIQSFSEDARLGRVINFRKLRLCFLFFKTEISSHVRKTGFEKNVIFRFRALRESVVRAGNVKKYIIYDSSCI